LQRNQKDVAEKGVQRGKDSASALHCLKEISRETQPGLRKGGRVLSGKRGKSREKDATRNYTCSNPKGNHEGIVHERLFMLVVRRRYHPITGNSFTKRVSKKET